MDNAIWHKSRALEVPPNIQFAFIPPYTPDMNPIEQVWAEIRKRGFKNRAFQTLESVIDKLQEIIQGLDSETLKSIVHRKWICSDFEIEWVLVLSNNMAERAMKTLVMGCSETVWE